jgi:hypothetical protein
VASLTTREVNDFERWLLLMLMLKKDQIMSQEASSSSPFFSIKTGSGRSGYYAAAQLGSVRLAAFKWV